MVFVKWLMDTNINELDLVGGKNASLGTMMQNLNALNVKIPNGFVITTKSYDEFIKYNNIEKKSIKGNFENLGLEKLVFLYMVNSFTCIFRLENEF